MTKSLKQIEKMIEDWHFNGAGEGQELHEYLGWTWEEYVTWVNTGIIPNGYTL